LEIVNKVAQSGIITFDLEELFPSEPIEVFDLKDHLFKGMILREKDFREALAKTDWQQFSGKYLTVFCSADAIIPNWAYMLVAAYAQPFAISVYMGNKDEAIKKIYAEKLTAIDAAQYSGQRVVVKGCSNKPVPVEAYLELTRILKPVVKSIMYGEPCSTVPIYKKPN
jgi:hypothetical protein